MILQLCWFWLLEHLGASLLPQNFALLIHSREFQAQAAG